MTPVQFLEQAEALRPELIRTAESITRDYGAAQDVVQDAILYAYGDRKHPRVHLFDETKSSLLTYLTRSVVQRANNAKKTLGRLYPSNAIPQFSDLATYNPTDPSMKAVHEAGLPQVRMQEPGDSRRAMSKEKPEGDPSFTPNYDDVLDVHAALALLPVKQREAAVAVFMNGYAEDEYAKEIGVSRPTVARRICLARKSLRKILK